MKEMSIKEIGEAIRTDEYWNLTPDQIQRYMIYQHSLDEAEDEYEDEEEPEEESYFLYEDVSAEELEESKEVIRKAMSNQKLHHIAEAADLIDRYTLKGEKVDLFGNINPVEVLCEAEAEYNKSLGGLADWYLTHAVQEWDEPIGDFCTTAELRAEEQRMARMVLSCTAELIKLMIEDMAA